MELYIIIAFFIVVEYFFKDKSYGFLRKGFWLDAIWYAIVQGLILQYVVYRFIDMFFARYEFNLLSSLPFLVQLICAILIIEFFAYWIHRANHRFSVMWRIHETHHTSLELDWLSANRIHFTEAILIKIIGAAIIVLMGASIKVLYVYMLFDLIMGAFIHSNIKGKIRSLKYIFNSPEMHHVHHSNNFKHQNSNFGDKITIYDWIFGTALVLTPKQMEETKYGIGYDYPQDLVGQIMFIFRKREPIDNIPE